MVKCAKTATNVGICNFSPKSCMQHNNIVRLQIEMDKKIKKWKRINWAIMIPTLLALLYVIFQVSLGGINKQLSTAYCLVIFGVILGSNFIFAVVTKHTYASHILINKDENPELYQFMTIFYAFCSLCCFILSIKYF